MTQSDIIANDAGKQEWAAIDQLSSLWSTKGNAWRKKPQRGHGKVVESSQTIQKKESKSGKSGHHCAMAIFNRVSEQWFAIVENHNNTQLKRNAYTNYMTYGRMIGFKELKARTQDNTDQDLILAALKAPLYMYKETDQEKSAFCPWAKPYLDHKNLKIAAAAGKVMVKCKGQYIDALLEEGKKRVANQDFSKPFSQVFREPCFEFMKGVTGVSGQQEQCDAVYAFLESVANTDTLSSTVRGSALWNIYYQRRDQQTLDLMRQYENHRDVEIQKRAKSAIHLTTTYKLK